MPDVLLKFAPMVVGVFTFAAMIALVRWARNSKRSAALLGSALFLIFGGALVPPISQQRIEEAREDKGKKGAESGDPPHSLD